MSREREETSINHGKKETKKKDKKKGGTLGIEPRTSPNLENPKGESYH